MINGVDLWEKSSKDGVLEALSATEATLDIFKKFIIEEVPKALTATENNQATAHGIILAKIAVGQQLIDSGLAKEMAEAHNTNCGAGLFSALMTVSVDLFQESVDDLRPLAENMEGLLEEYGLTEEDLLNRIGVSAENQALMAAGNLTIGQLALSQPITVLKLN